MVFAIHWHESAMDLHVFPILIPPSHPSGSSQCTSPKHLSHASNLGWWSVSQLIIYIFQCYSCLIHRMAAPALVLSPVRKSKLFCFRVSKTSSLRTDSYWPGWDHMPIPKFIIMVNSSHGTLPELWVGTIPVEYHSLSWRKSDLPKKLFLP